MEQRVRLLLYAGLLLLVIACAKAASVLLAQMITRGGEYAVRAALGAGRTRLARQLTAEGIVLGTAGGALGLALAPLFATLLRPMTSPFLPAVGLPAIDVRVMVGGTMASVGIEGRPMPPGQLPQSAYFSVGETYFALFRVPLRRGRLVNPRSPEPEFMVNETMARRFWPDGDAVGARIRVGPVQTGPWAQVVGVVADMRDSGPADTVRAIAFGSNRHSARPVARDRPAAQLR